MQLSLLCSPRNELGDKGLRDRLILEVEGGGEESNTGGTLLRYGGLRSPAAESLGDGEGEPSETGRR
jgi:hypothetical protein